MSIYKMYKTKAIDKTYIFNRTDRHAAAAILIIADICRDGEIGILLCFGATRAVASTPFPLFRAE